MMDIAPFLRQVPLFAACGPAELRKLGAISSLKVYAPGAAIFDENMPGDRLYIVAQGRVKIFASSGTRRKTLAFLEPGEFFGEMALLEPEQRSASSVALEETRLIVISKNDFTGLLSRSPHLSLQIMRTLSARLRQADREIQSLVFGNVLGRVASVLYEFSKKHGKKTPEGCVITLALSHQDMAEIAGTAREMVTRALARLRRLRCIGTAGKHIIITDEEKLKQWIS